MTDRVIHKHKIHKVEPVIIQEPTIEIKTQKENNKENIKQNQNIIKPVETDDDPITQQFNLKMQSILEEYDIEVVHRIKLMQQKSDSLVGALKSSCSVVLMQLSKSVRTLNMRQFLRTYEGLGDFNTSTISSVSNNTTSSSLISVSTRLSILPKSNAPNNTTNIRHDLNQQTEKKNLLGSPLSINHLATLSKEDRKQRLLAAQQQLNALLKDSDDS